MLPVCIVEVIKLRPDAIRGDQIEDGPFVLGGIERGVGDLLQAEYLFAIDQIGGVGKAIGQIDDAPRIFVRQFLKKLFDDTHKVVNLILSRFAKRRQGGSEKRDEKNRLFLEFHSLRISPG
jgi:hypothetical protein